MGKKKNKIKKAGTYRFNKRLDSLFLQSGSFEVNTPFAFRQLGGYMTDVENIERGLTLDEIGIKTRREEKATKIINQEGNVIASLKDFESNDFDFGSEPEETVYRIARLNVSGMMRMESGLSSRGIRETANEIMRLDANPNIHAIIIEANSGGGEKISGQHLLNSILDCSIPVFGHGHFVASAMARSLLACDKLFMAGEQAEYGSLGTMSQIDKRVANWYKENMDDIYSGNSPKKNHEWREYLKGNKGPIIEKLASSSEGFKETVLKYRNVPSEYHETTFDGSVMEANEAIKRNLVDGVGTFNYVVEQVVSFLDNGSTTEKNSEMTKTEFQAFKENLEKVTGSTFKAENIKDLKSEMEKATPVSKQIEDAKKEGKVEAEKGFDDKFAKLEGKLGNLETKKKKEKEGEEGEEGEAEPTETEKKFSAFEERLAKLETRNGDLETENKGLKKKVAKKKVESSTAVGDVNTGNPDPLEDLKSYSESVETEIEFEW